jgi:hypothetical protein
MGWRRRLKFWNKKGRNDEGERFNQKNDITKILKTVSGCPKY